VKRHPEAPDPVACIGVNALFPHRLGAVCARHGVRLIQLSTDCVFSGRRGGYRECDPPDPEDLYGRSKLLGELDRPGCLTLRTSMIGRELGRQRGLLEWFLAQRGGAVRGFRRAIFTGLTTPALSRILVRVIGEHPGLAGIWHVGSEPISKHDLLVGVRDGAGLDIRIAPDDTYACDRSLDSTRFRRATGITPPSWVEMLDELCAELRAVGGGRHAD
jgi:dTDP-4-dehydrorhamnose reductase